MDPEAVIVPTSSLSRTLKEWPRLFSKSRKPTDDQPFIDSLRGHNPINDGVRLFMQHYDDDRTLLDIEIVVRFCQDVHPNDFNTQISSKKGTAWLDDRAIPPVSELAVHDVHPQVSSSVETNTNNQDSGLVGDHDREMLIDDGCDITDALGSVTLCPISQAARIPRTYEEYLTARELHKCLREKRFNHATLEDADRRLIHIADPDPCDMLALTETAPEYQKSALQATLWQYLALETCLKVKVSSTGYPVFHLELHFPYFSLRQTCLKDMRKRGGKRMHRWWMDLSFLEIEEGDWVMHQAQFSFTICGTDNSRWIAYCLEDTSFDTDREIGDDEHIPEWRSDQISLGKLDANFPIWNPQEYFAIIYLIRTRQVVQEIRNLVRAVEVSYERNTMYRSFLSACGDEDSATWNWIEKMQKLLSILIRDISKKANSWTLFASPDKDIGYFHNMDSTISPSTKARIQKTLAELETEFDELKSFIKRLRDIEELCEKLATRLEHNLVWHGSKNGEFTLLVISPIVIVASIFAIPTPVVAFERNGVSFIVSVALVMLILKLVMLLRGGWLRRQSWWDKLSRRTKGVWHGDPTITVQNESGPRVLRRRSTHAGFCKEK